MKQQIYAAVETCVKLVISICPPGKRLIECGFPGNECRKKLPGIIEHSFHAWSKNSASVEGE